MYGQIVAVANINPAEYNVYCVDISNDTEKKKNERIQYKIFIDTAKSRTVIRFLLSPLA